MESSVETGQRSPSMEFTEEQRLLVALLRSVICDEDFDPEDGIKFTPQILETIHAQRMDYLTKTALEKAGRPVPDEIRKNAAEQMLLLARQHKAAKDTQDALDAASIAYIPMKGSHLAAFYPSKLVRYMSDTDLLLHEEDLDAASKVMEGLGFSALGPIMHHGEFERGSALVELHRYLFPKSVADYYEYFGDGWKMARQAPDGSWQMTPEAEFIYVLSHCAKHYREGDPRVFQLTDVYLLSRMCDLDAARELSKQFHIEGFMDNVMRLLDVWFGDAPLDETTLRITDTIFERSSAAKQQRVVEGIFGSASEGEGSTKANAAAALARKLFPSREVVEMMFPRADIKWYNLPFYHVKRWGVYLFSPEMKSLRDSLRQGAKGETGGFQDELNAIGLAQWDGAEDD